jgi:hemoglobin/transferrin/lactoferrin receptor protein
MAPSEIEKSYLYAKDGNGNPYAPNWYTVNLKAMFTLNKTWSFTGGIENITDQLYRSYSSGISAPGRNFVTSLRVNF